MTLTFTVFGVAQSKGSARAFVPKGWTRPIITDSNRSLKQWSQLVAEGANRALAAAPDAELLTEGVRLTVAIFLPRPKKYQRGGSSPRISRSRISTSWCAASKTR